MPDGGIPSQPCKRRLIGVPGVVMLPGQFQDVAETFVELRCNLLPPFRLEFVRWRHTPAWVAFEKRQCPSEIDNGFLIGVDTPRYLGCPLVSGQRLCGQPGALVVGRHLPTEHVALASVRCFEGLSHAAMQEPPPCGA